MTEQLKPSDTGQNADACYADGGDGCDFRKGQAMTRLLKAFAGGIGCAVTWWLMDRYLWGEIYDAKYYVAVVCAYVAGTGPISKSGWF